MGDENVVDYGDTDNDIVEEPTEPAEPAAPAEPAEPVESVEPIETDAPIGHPDGFVDPNEKDDAPIAEPGG